MRLQAAVLLGAAALAGCGGGEPPVARVGHAAITEADVKATLRALGEEAEAEGREFPEPGSPGYAAVRRQALALLVSRAQVEQAARALGVQVDGDEVKRRVQAAAEQDAGAEASVRAQLVRERAFPRVTADVFVTDAEVDRYYASHRSFYTRRPKAAARETIHAQLLAEKRNRAFDAWVARAAKEYPPRYASAAGTP